MIYVLAFFNIIHCFIIFDFMNKTYKKKYSNQNTYFAAYLIIYLLQVVVNVNQIFLANILFTILIVQIIGTVLYKDMPQKSLYSLLFGLYLIFIDIFSFTIISLFIQKPLIQIVPVEYYMGIALMIYYSMILSTYKLLINKFLKGDIYRMNMRQDVFFVILAIFEIVTVFYLWNSVIESSVILLSFISIGFIGLDIYLIYLIGIVYKHREMSHEMNLANQQTTLFRSNIYDMQNKYEQSRKLIHDMRGLLRVSEELYVAGEFDTANKLKSQVENSLNKLEGRYHCDNIIMNVIINDRLSASLSMGIKTNISIQNDIDWSFITEMEMSTLFLNLFNNAIEACEEIKSGIRHIDLRIGKINENIVINMQNSFVPEKLMVKGEKYISSKAGHFGIGLGNIRKVVESYNGIMKVKPESDVFVVQILLCTIKPEEVRKLN